MPTSATIKKKAKKRAAKKSVPISNKLEKDLSTIVSGFLSSIEVQIPKFDKNADANARYEALGELMRDLNDQVKIFEQANGYIAFLRGSILNVVREIGKRQGLIEFSKRFYPVSDAKIYDELRIFRAFKDNPDEVRQLTWTAAKGMADAILRAHKDETESEIKGAGHTEKGKGRKTSDNDDSDKTYKSKEIGKKLHSMMDGIDHCFKVLNSDVYDDVLELERRFKEYEETIDYLLERLPALKQGMQARIKHERQEEQNA